MISGESAVLVSLNIVSYNRRKRNASDSRTALTICSFFDSRDRPIRRLVALSSLIGIYNADQPECLLHNSRTNQKACYITVRPIRRLAALSSLIGIYNTDQPECLLHNSWTNQKACYIPDRLMKSLIALPPTGIDNNQSEDFLHKSQTNQNASW